MTYTAGQLREWADHAERYLQAGCPADAPEPVGNPDQLRAHADALEELAILKNADVGMMWAQMQEDLRDFDAMKARAERAESALADATQERDILNKLLAEPENKVRARLFLAERKCERLKALLHSLHSLVWGECPSLLNEDSGGSGHLDADICAEFKE